MVANQNFKMIRTEYSSKNCMIGLGTARFEKIKNSSSLFISRGGLYFTRATKQFHSPLSRRSITPGPVYTDKTCIHRCNQALPRRFGGHHEALEMIWLMAELLGLPALLKRASELANYYIFILALN